MEGMAITRTRTFCREVLTGGPIQLSGGVVLGAWGKSGLEQRMSEEVCRALVEQVGWAHAGRQDEDPDPTGTSGVILPKS